MKIYSTYGTTPWWDYRESIKRIIIEEQVQSISNQAFNCCSNVNSITLATSLREIGYNAFRGCRSLTSITIPANVRVISGDGQTFADCDSLKEIVVKHESKHYVFIDGVLFIKDMKTFVSYPGGKNGTTYTIPDSVETVLGMAFSNNQSLESITIPLSVKKIDDPYLVYNCNNLTNVYYKGTKNQYEAIEKYMGTGKNAYTLSSTVNLVCANETSSAAYVDVQRTNTERIKSYFLVDKIRIKKKIVNIILKSHTHAKKMEMYIFPHMDGVEEMANLA